MIAPFDDEGPSGMKVSSRDKLREFYKQFCGADRVLIVISADPDAIASAMAAGRLLWRRVESVTMACVNAVDRPDNLAMIRLLKVSLVPLAQVQPDAFTKTVLVDSQPSHHKLMSALNITAVIDHHPETGAKAPFVDVRPSYGSTATILTEYLRAARVTPSRNLATALYHAIKTDTDDFKRQTLVEDLHAFQYLFRHANIALARRIGQADLRLEYLKYFKNALQTMRLRKGRVFVHLGPVANPDVCVIIADFFLRIHTVSWSIVSGTCDQKLVVIFRNDGQRKNAGRVAKESFGGFGPAGGHRTMARAEIGLADVKAPPIDFKDDRKVAAWIVIRTEKRAGTKPAAPKPETAEAAPNG
jgi:nanoRNase/pAp phosphatase (c-di-AMP/oligoRNAs hydrolase)